LPQQASIIGRSIYDIRGTILPLSFPFTKPQKSTILKKRFLPGKRGLSTPQPKSRRVQVTNSRRFRAAFGIPAVRSLFETLPNRAAGLT
jgi:hypothetical protein